MSIKHRPTHCPYCASDYIDHSEQFSEWITKAKTVISSAKGDLKCSL